MRSSKIPQAEEGEKVLAVKPQAMPEPTALTASAKARTARRQAGMRIRTRSTPCRPRMPCRRRRSPACATYRRDRKRADAGRRLQERLGDLYPQLDETQLAELLARAFFLLPICGARPCQDPICPTRPSSRRWRPCATSDQRASPLLKTGMIFGRRRRLAPHRNRYHEADLMQDIRGAVDVAIREGRTEQWFLNELAPILKKKAGGGKRK